MFQPITLVKTSEDWLHFGNYGIKRRKSDSAAKYANRAFQCQICKWGYSDKYKDKAKEHAEECPASWIFEEWKPQSLEDLKFIKS